MKVQVKLELGGRTIHETVSGANAGEIVATVKGHVERELGWKGIFLMAMSPVGFAQEAVRRLNASMNANYALPQTADDFIKLGIDLGIVTVVEA